MPTTAALEIAVRAANIDETNRKLGSLDRSGARAARSAENLERKFSRANVGVAGFNQTMLATGNVIRLVRFPAMIAGAGLAAQALGALAGGAVALGAALAPLAGLGAAAGAGYLAFGQALAVIKVAQLDRIGQALSGNKAAMKSLGPEARAFARDLRGSLAPAFKDLRSTIQENLFGQLSGALPGVRSVMAALSPIAGRTATAIGQLGAQAARLVGGRGVLNDLRTIGNANTFIIRNLGQGAIALGHALLTVLAAAEPMTRQLAVLARTGALWVDAQVSAARAGGQLTGFFQRTLAVTGQLARTGRDFAVALFNIARAGAPLGGELLTSLEHLAARFRDWTESAQGRNQIAEYFQQIRGPLYAAFGLIGDVGRAFLELSRSTVLQGVIEQLRPIVPMLQNIIAGTTATLGPALAEATVQILRLVQAFIGTSGPLNIFVRGVGTLAGALASLINSVPGLGAVLAWLVGLRTVVVILSPLAGLITSMTVALIGQAAAANTAGIANLGMRASLIATAIAMRAWAAAEIAATIATRVLGVTVALLTSPFTWWIVALAAIAAGLIYAYNHITPFRNAVNAVWDAVRTGGMAAFGWLRDHWPLVLSIITGPFGAALIAIVRNWSKIRGAASDGMRAVINTINGFAGQIKALGGSIVDWIVSGLRAGVNKIVDFLNTIISIINKLPGVNIGRLGHIGDARPGQQNLGGTGHLARGGAYGRTGGMVNNPMVFMGEEAPSHPEYVIPTNPAYRNRARGLLAEAMGKIGFQAGGVWSKSQLAALWSRVNPGLGDPNLMAAIALAESGGHEGIVNSIGAGGFWQIYPPEAGYLDPVTNARIAGRKLRSQGLGAWEAYTNGSYRQFLGGGGGGIGGLLSGIGGFLGQVLDKGVGWLTGQLPGVGGLPGWAQGMGRNILGQVTDWIKDKVSGLLGGGGQVPAGVAGSISNAIAIASGLGFAHPGINQLTGGNHVADSWHYKGRAADFGAAGHSVAQMTALFNTFRQHFGSHILEMFYDPIGYYIKNGRPVPGAIGGHSDHLHLALARGGVWGGRGRPNAYADGTGGAKRGWGWVGEKGAELVRFAGGEQVLKHSDSMRAFNDMPGYASGTAAARAAAARARARAAEAQAQARARAAKRGGGGGGPPPGLHGIPLIMWRRYRAKGRVPRAAEEAPMAPLDTGPFEDPNQALIDAQNAAAAAAEAQRQAAEDLAAQIVALKDEVKRNTDFAQGVTATENAQFTKGLADLLSGQLAGYGVAGRALTPGTGVEHRY